MLIPFDNQAMWMCDFCLRAEPEMAHVSRHTHAVICASCIKILWGCTAQRRNLALRRRLQKRRKAGRLSNGPSRSQTQATQPLHLLGPCNDPTLEFQERDS